MIELVTPRRNIHPVDELADVRAKIKSLEVREEELRDALLSPEASKIGVQWEASIKTHKANRFDLRAATRYFGTAALQPFMRLTPYKTVNLKRRKNALSDNS